MTLRFLPRAMIFLVVALPTASAARVQNGASLYAEHCASCHDSGVARAPRLSVLRGMSAEAVLRSLEIGTMARMGVFRTDEERRLIAEFVAGEPMGAGNATSREDVGRCVKRPIRFDAPFDQPHWNGWGVDLTNRRFQPEAMADLMAEQVGKLELEWAFGFPDAIMAFSQPTVVAGRVFVGSANSTVYCLDSRSGCVYWSFRASDPVRCAISIGPISRTNPARYAAFFGDTRARVYAVDAVTGELLWKVPVEEHQSARITGSPQLYEGTLYVPVSSSEEGIGANPRYQCCRFRGSVVALEASSGSRRWKTYTIEEEPQPVRKNRLGVQLWGPSGAGIWSAPTIDPKLGVLYVATGDNYSDPPNETSDAVLALDLETGKIVWSKQVTEGDAYNMACDLPDKSNCPEAAGPDFDFGTSPILVSLPNGKRALLAGQKSGLVHAFDPDRAGEILWQVRVGKGGKLGGIQWGPAADEQKIYVAISDIEGKIKKDAKRGFQAVPDPNKGGGLFALDIETGKRIWYAAPVGCDGRERCSPAQSAAVTAIPGVVFSGSIDGHLRAYSSQDGGVIWDFDTVREYETTNGVAARGGSLDSAGPTVVGGMVYVNSGYGFWGGMPGNVLLAFSVPER